MTATSVEIDAAGGGQRRAQHRLLRGYHPESEILGARGIDGDARLTRSLIGIFGDELHVHEGRFAGLVEMLARDHRIVPIEYLAPRIGRPIGCSSTLAEQGDPVTRATSDKGDGGSGQAEPCPW
jgi:hypothetical protein